MFLRSAPVWDELSRRNPAIRTVKRPGSNVVSSCFFAWLPYFGLCFSLQFRRRADEQEGVGRPERLPLPRNFQGENIPGKFVNKSSVSILFYTEGVEECPAWCRRVCVELPIPFNIAEFTDSFVFSACLLGPTLAT